MTKQEIAERLRSSMPYVVWDRCPGEGDGPTLLEQTAAVVERLIAESVRPMKQELQAMARLLNSDLIRDGEENLEAPNKEK